MQIFVSECPGSLLFSLFRGGIIFVGGDNMKKNVVLSNELNDQIIEYAKKNEVPQCQVIERSISLFLVLDSIGMTVVDLIRELIQKRDQSK